MKVLWTVNCLPPNIAKQFSLPIAHSISWVEAMSKKIKDKITLAIVCPTRINKPLTKNIDGISYYVIPLNCISHKSFWDKIISDFKPEIIHAYGTEMLHNYYLVKYYSKKIPIIVSLQGIISEYIKYFFAGLNLFEIFKNISLFDFIKNKGILGGYIGFLIQEKYEKYILSNVRYVEGRSNWDKLASKNINPNLKYYFCPRMIREAFFHYNWKKEEAEPLSIFIHQGGSPIKGLHILLDALNIVKKYYPNFKLYISGDNIFSKKGLIKKLKESSYTNIIKRRIIKYNLLQNIYYTGYLDSQKLAKKLSEVSLCINSSSIENMPNSVAEAMLVGTPVIASYVGGTPEMLNYGEYGFLYNYNEPNILANIIISIFSNQDEAISKANKAKINALRIHSPKQLVDNLLDIYNSTITDWDCKQ